MGCSERQKELKRRQHRKEKVDKLKKRAAKASASEKAMIADKLRKLSPGAETLIQQMELEKS